MFGIGAVIGKVFGTDKAITSVIDNASSALDKLVYTSEEKADDHTKSVTQARTMVIDWLKNTQGQNIARRIIALIVTGMWSLNIILIQLLSVVSVWVDASDKCIASADILKGTGTTITSAMMLVLAFYFAAPQMGKFADAALKKFSAHTPI